MCGALRHSSQGQQRTLSTPASPARLSPRSELESSEPAASAFYETAGPPAPAQQSQGGKLPESSVVLSGRCCARRIATNSRWPPVKRRQAPERKNKRPRRLLIKKH